MPISKSYIMKQFLQLDMFAKPVCLLIKKEEGHKTILASILSLGIFSILGLLLYGQLVSLFSRDNPISFSNEIHIEKPEEVLLQPHNFTLQFDFEDASFRHYINSSVYVVSANLMHKFTEFDPSGQATVKFEAQPLPIIVCTNASYQQTELAQYFLAFDYRTQYCVDWNKINNSILLRGNYDSPEFRYVEFVFSLCNNNTSDICMDRIEMLEFTNTHYFSMQVTSSNTDLTNAYYPHKYTGKDIFTTVSNKMFKQIDIYFKQAITITDYGILSDDIQTIKTLQFSRIEERVLLSSDDILLKVLFRLDTVESTNYRSYPKIQDIFGQIGGLYQVLFIVCAILYEPIRTLSQKLQIINSLFNFETEESATSPKKPDTKNIQSEIKSNATLVKSNKMPIHKHSKQSLLRTQTMKSLQNLKSRPQGHSVTSQLSHFKQMSKNIKLYLTIVSQKLRLGCTDYLQLCFGCFKLSGTKKHRIKIIKEQIEFSESKIQKTLDILYIIKKLNELDRLKMILLDQDQINLFNYLPKPTISVIPNQSQGQSYYSIFKNEKSNYQTAVDAQQSYQKINKNQQIPINAKLMSMMDTKVKDLLNLEMHPQDNNRVDSVESDCQFNNYFNEDNNQSSRSLEIRSPICSPRDSINQLFS